ncbi:hypothetical protein OSTOST_21541 [Ostertagia ostertagi]
MRKAVRALLLAALAVFVDSAKVLFMPSTLYPMHGYTMKYLADELARRNHDITWLEYGPVQVNFAFPEPTSAFNTPVNTNVSVKTTLPKAVKRVYCL